MWFETINLRSWKRVEKLDRRLSFVRADVEDALEVLAEDGAHVREGIHPEFESLQKAVRWKRPGTLFDVVAPSPRPIEQPTLEEFACHRVRICRAKSLPSPSARS